MTQSGQGDEQQLPAARPAHEGVVLPSDGSGPWIPAVTDEQAAPAGGRPWGDPWGPEQPPGQPQQPGPQPEYGAYEPQQQYGQPAQGSYEPQQHQQYGQPTPGAYDQQTQYQQAQYGEPQQYAQPPQGDYGAQALSPQGPPPQALPPQALPPQNGLPPQAAGPGDSDATQYISPVPPVTSAPQAAPGALPPEVPADSTQFLGTRPLPGTGSDAEATQYIAPVPAAPAAAPFGIRPGTPGERQPPAEFDSLFRTDAPPAAEPADATQQMPRFEDPRGAQPPYQQPQYQQQQQYQPAYQEPERESRRRKSSHVPVIAAVVIGCAVLGLGVSAVMFGGGDDEKDDPGSGKNVAASSPAPSSSPKVAADPAEPQAEALDKLLADSNNSRSSVIRSVENIKQCDNLDQAATDLRAAAKQRRGLVTQLDGLTVDKLPNNAKLTSSLTKAWKASASADDHYAAWAVQAKSKKVCKGGKARSTNQTGQANRASGEATAAKKQASGLWNGIAEKYELTKRRSDQL